MKLSLILIVLIFSTNAFAVAGACGKFISEGIDIEFIEVEGMCLIDEDTSLDDLTYNGIALRYSEDLKLFYTIIVNDGDRAALIPNDILYVLEPGNELAFGQIIKLVTKAFTSEDFGNGEIGPVLGQTLDELAKERRENERLREENRKLREENRHYNESDTDPELKELEKEMEESLKNGNDNGDIGIPTDDGQSSGEMVALINSPSLDKNILGIGMLTRAYRHQNRVLRKLNRYSNGRKIRRRPQGSDRIRSHSWMNEGEYLKSRNGKYKFVLRGDGNLVLYSGKKAIWSSKTGGKGKYPFKLKMQRDGNLVVYGMGKAIWSSKTNKKGRGPYRLVMQSDRNVVLYDSLGKALWSTSTWIR